LQLYKGSNGLLNSLCFVGLIDFAGVFFFFFPAVVLGDILIRPNLVLCFVFKDFQTGYMAWFLRLDWCFFGTLKPHCLFYLFFFLI
jgi:hypothetical protein